MRASRGQAPLVRTRRRRGIVRLRRSTRVARRCAAGERGHSPCVGGSSCPGEAAEALLELATGGEPKLAPLPAPEVAPFDHPDAQRRFRIMTNVEELALALPNTRGKNGQYFSIRLSESWSSGTPTAQARVSGSAGTGKTIVALHRAAHLARSHPEARVLLTTFSATLANALHTKLKRLVGSEPRLAERIDVHSINALGLRLHKSHCGPANLVSAKALRELIGEAPGASAATSFGLHFLLTEWEQVVDAWQLESWESYRDVARLGRKTRLPEAQRAVLWSIFERVRGGLTGAQAHDHGGGLHGARVRTGGSKHPPFDFAVVDEAQDISVAQLRFLAALGGDRPNALFFAGDLGQRIFQQPFSWRSLGVDIRGRSRNLRVNYRTSHQIRIQADRLLGPEVNDADGNSEDRSDTISVFNGPPPVIRVLPK